MLSKLGRSRGIDLFIEGGAAIVLYAVLDCGHGEDEDEGEHGYLAIRGAEYLNVWRRG